MFEMFSEAGSVPTWERETRELGPEREAAMSDIRHPEGNIWLFHLSIHPQLSVYTIFAHYTFTHQFQHLWLLKEI